MTLPILCTYDDSWAKDCLLPNYFNLLEGKDPQKIYQNLIGITTLTSGEGRLLTRCPLSLIKNRDIFKFESKTPIDSIQPDKNNSIDPKPTFTQILPVDINIVNKTVKIDVLSIESDNNKALTSRKILRCIIDTHKEPANESRWARIKDFFSPPEVEVSKLYKVLNRCLLDSQQTLINYLIQSNSSNKLIHPELLFLINHKADINLQNNDGNTLAHIYYLNYVNNHINQRLALISDFATRQNEKQKIKPLEAKNGIEYRKSKDVIIFNDLKIFLENKADLSLKNKDGNTPLHCAMMQQEKILSNLDAEKIYDLLDEYKKNDVLDIQNNKGITVFMLLVRELLFNYKNLKLDQHIYRNSTTEQKELIKDKKKQNFLHYLADSKLKLESEKIVNLYQNYPAALEEKNNQNETPLSWACSNLDSAEISKLEEQLDFKKNSLQNSADKNGNVFLHKKSYLFIDKKLIPSLLDVNKDQIPLKNKAGQTPMHILMKEYPFDRESHSYTSNDSRLVDHSHTQMIIENILTKDVFDTQDNKGDSVFSYLFKSRFFNYKHREIWYIKEWLNKFLGKNPNLSLKNKKGNTPFHLLIRLILPPAQYIKEGENKIAYCYNNKAKYIDIPKEQNINDLLSVINNRDETPLLYAFNSKHRWSEKNIAKKAIYLLSQSELLIEADNNLHPCKGEPRTKRIPTVTVENFYSGIFSKREFEMNKKSSGYLKRFFSYDEYSIDDKYNVEDIKSIKERVLEFTDNFMKSDPKFMSRRLEETKKYVNRKYLKYANESAYLVFIMKHLTTCPQLKNKNKNRFIIPLVLVKKLALEYFKCSLEKQLQTLIDKLESNEAVNDDMMQKLNPAAKEFLKIKKAHKDRKREI